MGRTVGVGRVTANSASVSLRYASRRSGLPTRTAQPDRFMHPLRETFAAVVTRTMSICERANSSGGLANQSQGAEPLAARIVAT